MGRIKNLLGTAVLVGVAASYVTANELAGKCLRESQGTLLTDGVRDKGPYGDGRLRTYTIFGNPETGEARETWEGILAPGPLAIRHSREPTPEEKDWYRKNTIGAREE